MSMDTESVGKIEQAKRPLRSMVEALVAISAVEDSQFPNTEHSGPAQHWAIYLGQAFDESVENAETRLH